MTKNEDTNLVSIEQIGSKILQLRGQRVILDRDLAAIYGVRTGRLNEAVKRSIDRFPADFMFQLTSDEVGLVRSQIAILDRGRGSNLKFLPYAFTEYGAIQAANVLNSPRAVMMGIHVVRAFTQLRDLLASNKELAQKFAELERKLASHDQAITGILKTIRELMSSPLPEPKRRGIGFTADFDEE